MEETRKSVYEAVDTYQNGNISDFKKWLKRASKKDILDAVEYYSGNYGSRHIIINVMREYL